MVNTKSESKDQIKNQITEIIQVFKVWPHETNWYAQSQKRNKFVFGSAKIGKI